MGKYTKRKAARKKAEAVNTAVEFALLFIVAIVPILAIILCAAGVQIPKSVIGIYSSVAFTVAGALFIAFSSKEKFGFGKEGWGFNRFHGIKWMSKEEVKENTAVLGGLLIAIGIFFAVITVYYCF